MKYKIGDWVKIVNTKGASMVELGHYGQIQKKEGTGPFDYCVGGGTIVSRYCSESTADFVYESDIVPCCQHGAVEGDACTSCSASVHPSKKFKVGDRVKYTSGRHGWGEFNPRDKIGTIFEFSGLGYRVDWGSGKKNSYYAEDLEKIDEPAESVTVYPWYYYPSKSMSELLQEIKYYSGPSPRKELFMQKLSNLPQAIRRAFDKDQKALYRAGYIDQHGKWTPKAKDEADDEIQEKFLNENKAEFVSRAEEAIALAKEEKCDEECD